MAKSVPPQTNPPSSIVKGTSPSPADVASLRGSTKRAPGIDTSGKGGSVRSMPGQKPKGQNQSGADGYKKSGTHYAPGRSSDYGYGGSARASSKSGGTRKP